MDYQARIKELEEENARLKAQLNTYLLKNKMYYEKIKRNISKK